MLFPPEDIGAAPGVTLAKKNRNYKPLSSNRPVQQL
jgi:hypothetical protein